MKKLIIMLVASAMLFTGCKKAEPILTLVNAETNKQISYGMSKKDVEKTFGTAKTSLAFKLDRFDYNDELLITFRDNKVVHFTINSSEYKTSEGISVGDSAQDVIDKYGEHNRDSVFYAYYYSVNDGKLVQMKRSDLSEEALNAESLNRFIVEFFINDNKVQSIIVTDWKYRGYQE